MSYVAATSRSIRGLPKRQGVIEANVNKESDDMNTIRKLLKLNADKRAVTALEYGMIAALIAVVAITGFSTLGTKLSTTLSTVASVM
jgi:pilus assembly protein Flp/PilA